MSEINLEEMTFDELKQLEKDVAKAIKTFERRRMSEARAAVEATVRELGFSLSDLMQESKGKPKSAPTPKYRHPENAAQTWSGRGRKPRWFQEAIDAGVSPDELLIT